MDQNKILEKIMPGVEKMQNNIFISSITEGMMNAMPVLMASAFMQLFYSIPIAPWTNFLQNIGLYGLLTTVVDICNMSALFMVFGIGRALGDKKGINGVNAGLASLLCLLIVTPLTTDVNGTAAISTSSFGAQGIFTAMIVALLSSSIYTFFIQKNIVLKFPDSVPAFVSKSFAGIPAALATVLPFVAIRGLFSMTPFGSMTTFIYSMIQAPLTSLGNSLPAHLIAAFLCCLLWWLGVHGTMVILSVCLAFWQAPMVANLTAYNAGEPIPFVLSFLSFYLIIQFMGGPGCMFGLYLDMAFTAKSERYKAQGKLSLVPGLFNIVEPTVYGLPVVLNPILLIPFCTLPVVFYLAYYLLASAGIIGIPCVQLSIMVLPGPIAGFLLGGGLSLGIFVLACLAISCVVYYPFVRILDNQALKAEAKLAQEHSEDA